LLEGSFIDLGGFGEAADLAHELERGGADLPIGRGRVKIEKRSNVPAHAGNTALVQACVKRLGCKRALRAWSVRRLAGGASPVRCPNRSRVFHVDLALPGSQASGVRLTMRTVLAIEIVGFTADGGGRGPNDAKSPT
jgi:hypothetical protein